MLQIHFDLHISDICVILIRSIQELHHQYQLWRYVHVSMVELRFRLSTFHLRAVLYGKYLCVIFFEATSATHAQVQIQLIVENGLLLDFHRYAGVLIGLIEFIGDHEI